MPHYLIGHVPLDQEGQVAGDGQQQADSLFPAQKGEEPGHQGFPLPHGQRLQEAVIRCPAGTQVNIAGLS